MISENFSLGLKSQKKGPNYYPEHYSPKEKTPTQDNDLAPFIGDLSKSEKDLKLKHC